jgi:hypothetical protein
MSAVIPRPRVRAHEPAARLFARASLVHCFVGCVVLSSGATFAYFSEPYLNGLFILGFPASFICLWSATMSRFDHPRRWLRWAHTFSASVAGTGVGIAAGIWLCR